MGVHGTADQIAVPVHHVAYTDEMVIQTAEVGRALVGHPGDLHHAAVEAGDHVALRGDDLADGQNLPLHPEKGSELLFGRVLQDGALEVIDGVVEVGQQREERIDQGIHDEVEDNNLGRSGGGGVVVGDAILDLRQCGAVVLMDADDDFIGDEAVDLDDVLAIGRHAERDDVDEVVVLVDARPLTELLGRFHGHRVKVKRVDQQVRHVVVRTGVIDVEIEPEERAFGHRLLDDLWTGVR